MATITTLKEYVDSNESNFFYLKNVSVIDTIDNFEVISYVVIEPYLKILESYCITVTLDQEDINKYKYKPRLLSQIVYGTENLYYLILFLNDMTVETFIPKRIKVLQSKNRELIENIINKERLQGKI